MADSNRLRFKWLRKHWRLNSSVCNGLFGSLHTKRSGDTATFFRNHGSDEGECVYIVKVQMSIM